MNSNFPNCIHFISELITRRSLPLLALLLSTKFNDNFYEKKRTVMMRPGILKLITIIMLFFYSDTRYMPHPVKLPPLKDGLSMPVDSPTTTNILNSETSLMAAIPNPIPYRSYSKSISLALGTDHYQGQRGASGGAAL